METIKRFFRERIDSLRMCFTYLGELGEVQKTLIRQWTVSINTGTLLVPVWTEVAGIDNVAPTRSKANADTGDFSSGGWDEHLPAGRGRSLTCSGHYKEDPATGARDAGQAACEALADEIGPDGVGQFRFESPGGNGFTCKASADITGPGGGKNDAASWGVVVDMTGPPTALVP